MLKHPCCWKRSIPPQRSIIKLRKFITDSVAATQTNISGKYKPQIQANRIKREHNSLNLMLASSAGKLICSTTVL